MMSLPMGSFHAAANPYVDMRVFASHGEFKNGGIGSFAKTFSALSTKRDTYFLTCRDLGTSLGRLSEVPLG